MNICYNAPFAGAAFYLTNFNLNGRWVQHAADLAANSLSRQILSELGSKNTGASVCASGFSPNYAVIASLLLGLGLVDVCQSLAEIEHSFIFRLHAIEFDERSVVFLG